MSIEIEVGFRRPFVLGEVAGGVRETLDALGAPVALDGRVLLSKQPRARTGWVIEPLLPLELRNPVVCGVTHFAVVCGSPAQSVDATLHRRMDDQPPWPPDVPAREDDDEYWLSQPGEWDVTPARCRESAFLALAVVLTLARLSDGWIADRASGVWESHGAVFAALRPPADVSDPVDYVLARSGYAGYERRPCSPS